MTVLLFYYDSGLFSSSKFLSPSFPSVLRRIKTVTKSGPTHKYENFLQSFRRGNKRKNLSDRKWIQFLVKGYCLIFLRLSRMLDKYT